MHTLSGASFWPDSVISEANRKHYRDNTRLVDGFREDVRNSREVITFGSQFAQAVRLDPDAIKYIATQPLPKIPDHVERSVINAVLEPKERELTATGDLVSGFAKANAVVAEQSTLATGRTLAAAVEFQGRVQSKAFDLAGDAAEKMEKTQGYVQQKITTQASRVAADAVEVSGAVAAERRSAKGRLDAFGERVKGEAQGAILSFVGSAYRVGGWFSDDLKQETKVFDQAASQIRQQAMDK